MTLIINIVTPEGIIMASDSRQTERNIKQFTRISTNSAIKLFSLNDRVIVGTAGLGICNNGTLVLGTMNDGVISTSEPLIKGESYGVKNYNTFKFYDGIIKGRTGSVDGVISEQEANTQLQIDSEIIDGNTYVVNYLN